MQLFSRPWESLNLFLVLKKEEITIHSKNVLSSYCVLVTEGHTSPSPCPKELTDRFLYLERRKAMTYFKWLLILFYQNVIILKIPSTRDS